MTAEAKFEEFFPSKYLKAIDLEAREQRFTINDWHSELMQDGERALAVSLVDCSKKLILNKTNATTLRDALGEFRNWRGKSIELFITTAAYGAKNYEVIRIRIPKGAKAPVLDDEDTDALAAANERDNQSQSEYPAY